MQLVAKLDEHGKAAWIGVMVLAFILYWPAGVVILGYLLWSGRMGCWSKRSAGRWHGPQASNGASTFWSAGRRGQSSGNRAFDEYRDETLRRLEEEQSEFLSFLERLRQAKDKAEFDQFMADRKRRSGGTNDAEAPAQA